MARRFDLDELVSEDAVLGINGVDYPIPNALTIPMMARFLRMAEEIEQADTGDEAVQAMNDAHEAIVDYLKIRTPDANLQLTVEQILVAITFIVGDLDDPPAAPPPKPAPKRPRGRRPVAK